MEKKTLRERKNWPSGRDPFLREVWASASLPPPPHPTFGKVPYCRLILPLRNQTVIGNKTTIKPHPVGL